MNSLEELEDLHECVKPLLEEHGEVDIIRFGSLEEGEKVMGDGGSWVEISKNVVEFFEELEKRGRWDVIYELTRRGGKRARRAELIREWKERMKVPQEEEQARKKEHEELGKVIEQEVEGGGEGEEEDYTVEQLMKEVDEAEAEAREGKLKTYTSAKELIHDLEEYAKHADVPA